MNACDQCLLALVRSPRIGQGINLIASLAIRTRKNLASLAGTPKHAGERLSTITDAAEVGLAGCVFLDHYIASQLHKGSQFPYHAKRSFHKTK